LLATAAPYAAYVIDARTGEVLHSRNAEARLHPASLTKMMTLYVAFEAIRNGEITLDTQVRVSQNAASEQPSKLGLRAGQKIALRYLIRGAAVKSANDAATAIGEAISGSEAAFAQRMTRTARAMGMNSTTFRNAHGLTAEGHLSSARDMTILGRHLLYDYPQYYNLFSRTSTDAGVRMVNNTNRRLLADYEGADGIKTGYTSAAGFNLVASAQRGQTRVIATVFGGKSSAARNARVAELLDLGFRRAPSGAPVRQPAPPVYAGGDDETGASGKSVRVSGVVERSLRPRLRPAVPVQVAAAVADTAQEQQGLIQAGITQVITETLARPVQTATDSTPRPEARPSDLVLAAMPADTVIAEAGTVTETETTIAPEPEREVVTRISTSGGQFWGVNVGRYPSRYEAEKTLLRTALAEMSTLDGSLRKVVQGSRGFDANFMGMSREQADLACRRLQARNMPCFMIGPS
jgi:D-alanyl-D-alanine carboxypeptidase